MEAKKSWVRRSTRWSLTGVCVVMLWIGGYYGGRKAGFDAGREEGIAAGRPDGFRHGLDLMEFSANPQQTFDVAHVIDERLRNLPPGTPPDKLNPAIQAEMDKLVDEILRDVAPERWKQVDGKPCNVSGFSKHLTIMVTADPRMMAEVGAYLKSKDKYLAWRERGLAQAP